MVPSVWLICAVALAANTVSESVSPSTESDSNRLNITTTPFLISVTSNQAHANPAISPQSTRKTTTLISPNNVTKTTRTTTEKLNITLVLEALVISTADPTAGNVPATDNWTPASAQAKVTNVLGLTNGTINLSDDDSSNAGNLTNGFPTTPLPNLVNISDSNITNISVQSTDPRISSTTITSPSIGEEDLLTPAPIQGNLTTKQDSETMPTTAKLTTVITEILHTVEGGVTSTTEDLSAFELTSTRTASTGSDANLENHSKTINQIHKSSNTQSVGGTTGTTTGTNNIAQGNSTSSRHSIGTTVDFLNTNDMSVNLATSGPESTTTTDTLLNSTITNVGHTAASTASTTEIITKQMSNESLSTSTKSLKSSLSKELNATTVGSNHTILPALSSTENPTSEGWSRFESTKSSPSKVSQHLTDSITTTRTLPFMSATINLTDETFSLVPTKTTNSIIDDLGKLESTTELSTTKLSTKSTVTQNQFVTNTPGGFIDLTNGTRTSATALLTSKKSTVEHFSQSDLTTDHHFTNITNVKVTTATKVRNVTRDALFDSTTLNATIANLVNQSALTTETSSRRSDVSTTESMTTKSNGLESSIGSPGNFTDNPPTTESFTVVEQMDSNPTTKIAISTLGLTSIPNNTLGNATSTGTPKPTSDVMNDTESTGLNGVSTDSSLLSTTILQATNLTKQISNMANTTLKKVSTYATDLPTTRLMPSTLEDITSSGDESPTLNSQASTTKVMNLTSTAAVSGTTNAANISSPEVKSTVSFHHTFRSFPLANNTTPNQDFSNSLRPVSEKENTTILSQIILSSVLSNNSIAQSTRRSVSFHTTPSFSAPSTSSSMSSSRVLSTRPLSVVSNITSTSLSQGNTSKTTLTLEANITSNTTSTATTVLSTTSSTAPNLITLTVATSAPTTKAATTTTIELTERSATTATNATIAPTATRTNQPESSTLLSLSDAANNADKIVLTVVDVPPAENILSATWEKNMETRLLNMVVKAWLRSNTSNRRKRLVSLGGFKLQLLGATRDSTNPTRVQLLYVVEWLDSLVFGVDVESKVARLNVQDVVLTLQYPVQQPAAAVEGSQLTSATVPPTLAPSTDPITLSTTTEKFTRLELDLIIGLSVVGGLVVLGLLFWMICCCVITNKRKADQQQQDSISNNQSVALPVVSQSAAPTHQSDTNIPGTKALQNPYAVRSQAKLPERKPRRGVDSPDDGYSEASGITPPSDQALGSIYGHSETSSSRKANSRRRPNRIGPSLSTRSRTLPPVPGQDSLYSVVQKLPPLDNRKRFLTAAEPEAYSDRGDIEYYRNKQIQRALRKSRQTEGSKHSRHDERSEFDDGSSDEVLSSSRARVHKIIDQVLSLATLSGSKRLHRNSINELAEKKKKKVKKSDDSSSSSGSSSSSSSSSDSGSSKKKSKSSKGKKKKDKKKKKSKSKVGESSVDLKSADDEKDIVEQKHEPLKLAQTADPYAQFMTSPYSAADQISRLDPKQLPMDNEAPLTASWVLNSTSGRSFPKPGFNETSLTDTAPPGSHDWSARRTLNIPKPRLGTDEIKRLADLNSAANSDQYTSLVLSTSMFRSGSPSMDETTA